MNKPLFLLSFLLLVGCSAALGQVQPPNFICVSNDTLVWEPAANTCGPFVSYTIFGSQDFSGPYTEIATVSDRMQTSYFRVTPPGQTWYYYLISNYDCPGQPSLPSDTLDNRIPLPGPLRYVSVMDDNVEIRWSASPSPEVIGYVISRNTASGTVILDTAYNQTNFIDDTADPQNQSETYFVTAIDACGNSSLVEAPHQTLLLASTPPDSCDAGVVLSWNAYEPSAGATDYAIFGSFGGGPFQEVGRVPAGQTTFTYGEGNDGQNICFYVEAVLADNLRARSSSTCETIAIVQPLRRIDLLAADVLPDGRTTLTWHWDPTAQTVSASVNRSGAPEQPVTVSTPPTATVTYTDTTAQAGAGPLTYTVAATDACGSDVTSNTVRTIHLTGVAPGGGQNVLTWTAYEAGLPITSLTYELVKVAAGGEAVVYTTAANGDLTFTDIVDVTSPDVAGTCYYVRAQVSLALPDGTVTSPQTVRSNVACVQQQVTLYLPNVITPDSPFEENAVFRPFLAFEATGTYLLQVYDRWGSLVFESRDLSVGWDGSYRGRPAPGGVYLYYVYLEQEGGGVLSRTGDVTLIR